MCSGSSTGRSTSTTRPSRGSRPRAATGSSTPRTTTTPSRLAELFPPIDDGETIGYDIVVPTYWVVDRLLTNGWIEPIPIELIPNRTNIDPDFLGMPWDRGARHHLPWQVGITGIAYIPDRTPGPVESVEDLFDPALAARVAMVPEMRESVGLVMLTQGADPSRATVDTATQALDRIDLAIQSGQLAGFTGTFETGFDQGLAAMLAWSGDIVQLQRDRPDLGVVFVIPVEGAIRWFDSMVIPEGAANPTAAAAWMNFVYDPVNAAQITIGVQYISPVRRRAGGAARPRGRGRRPGREPDPVPGRRDPAPVVLLVGARRRRGGPARRPIPDHRRRPCPRRLRTHRSTPTGCTASTPASTGSQPRSFGMPGGAPRPIWARSPSDIPGHRRSWPSGPGPRSPRTGSGRPRRFGSSPMSSSPPACRSTIPATSPSCRRHRPRSRSSPTWPSAPVRSTPVHGSRAPGRCGPRTRPWAGWPGWPGGREGAGGCFVSGGTAGNLSALVTARHARRAGTHAERPDDGRWTLVAGETVHSSLATAAAVMDVELVVVPGERLTGPALAPVLADLGDRAFAVAATAGSTNLGMIDDLDSVASACERAGVWLHVDGAYGGAALAAPSVRSRFTGIERADSLIVDPHKWLFAPFDSCALLYRRPELARRCHAQHAGYLDILNEGGDWNPSDFAVHLSRRARGIPFWLSLAAYGTRAYAEAVDGCLAVARAGAELVTQRRAPRAAEGAGALDRRLPAGGLDGRRLPRLVATDAGRGPRRRRALAARRRADPAHVHRQSPHHGRRPRPGARFVAVRRAAT